MPWTLTVRAGPRVERRRFETLDDGLAALERQVDDLASKGRRQPVKAAYKKFDPIQQVAARIELAGPERFVPSMRGGVDVRGDGSTEAYLGRVRRQVVERRRGETSSAALRRALTRP